MSMYAFFIQRIFGPFFFALCIINLVLLHGFLKYLQETHLEVWKDLDEPEMFANMSPKSANKILDFVARRSYAKLGDKSLSERGDRLRAILFIQLGSLLAIMFIRFAKLIISGQ